MNLALLPHSHERRIHVREIAEENSSTGINGIARGPTAEVEGVCVSVVKDCTWDECVAWSECI